MKTKSSFGKIKAVLRTVLLLTLCTIMMCSCSNISVFYCYYESEAPTEGNPEASLPENKPTDPLKLTFCDTPLNESIITVSDGASYQVVNDRNRGQMLKLTSTSTSSTSKPSIKIDYKKYMELAGLDPAALNDCMMAVCYIKLAKTTDSRMEISLSGKGSDGSAITGKGFAEHKVASNSWQYVAVPLMDNKTDGVLDEIVVNYLSAPKNGEALYLHSITFYNSSYEALKFMEIDPYEAIAPKENEITVKGLSKEYTFFHLTDLHATALSPSDKAGMSASRLSYIENRRKAYTIKGFRTEERIYSYFKYAEDINADLMIMTGDIIDYPSEANVSLLYRAVNSSSIKSLFCLGNHDWTYADDYHTPNAVSKYIPKFEELCGGDPYFSYVEYEDLILVNIDNSTNKVSKDTVDKFFKLYEKNKPIVLSLHVPLYSEKLAEYGIEKEGTSYTMGGNALCKDDPNVKRLYEAVCLDENTPVVAVLAGHLHISFEESFPNGVPQYVTDGGFWGQCRILTLKPKN